MTTPCSYPRPKAVKYTVLRDTREKNGNGWVFAPSTACLGTHTCTLKTGDYTLEGFETTLCVERKGSLREFATNLFQKRFENELIRMADYEVAIVILEFDMEAITRWPEGSGIPKYKWKRLKLRSASIMKRFWELSLKYPYVHFIFAGYEGKEAASSLFKRFLENAKKGQK